MAAALIFVPGAMPAIDRNGGATVGTLYFYVPSTYTPKPVYTDNTLTTPHASPVVSDDAGNFPEIWADSAELFDVAFSRVNGSSFAIQSLAPSTVVVQGPQGNPGTNGTNGWTPELAAVIDGARRVHQVVGWAGGTGTPPATGLYVGASGLTAVLADAIDIRGPSGSGTGDVNTSGAVVDGHLAVFDGGTGDLIKDGGVKGALAVKDTVNNADWSGTDLAVNNGGTGASSFTQGGVLLGNGTDAVQVTAVGTAGHVLTSNGTGYPTFQAPSGGGSVPVAHFRQEQASGNNPNDTALSATWCIRTLNTTVINTIPGVAIAASQITGLPAGTYEVFANAITGNPDSSGGIARSRLRIYDATAGATLLLGPQTRTTNNTVNTSGHPTILWGQFTIASTKTIRLDQYPMGVATFGSPMGSGDVEIYNEIYLRKVA